MKKANQPKPPNHPRVVVRALRSAPRCSAPSPTHLPGGPLWCHSGLAGPERAAPCAVQAHGRGQLRRERVVLEAVWPVVPGGSPSQGDRPKRCKTVERGRCCVTLHPRKSPSFRNELSLRSTSLVSPVSPPPQPPKPSTPSVLKGSVAVRLPSTTPSHRPLLLPGTQEEICCSTALPVWLCGGSLCHRTRGEKSNSDCPGASSDRSLVWMTTSKGNFSVLIIDYYKL